MHSRTENGLISWTPTAIALSHPTMTKLTKLWAQTTTGWVLSVVSVILGLEHIWIDLILLTGATALGPVSLL